MEIEHLFSKQISNLKTDEFEKRTFNLKKYLGGIK